jgi:hypothetical protein
LEESTLPTGVRIKTEFASGTLIILSHREAGLYGLTEYEKYKQGIIDISISKKRNTDIITAAATVIHELEHARGGEEPDARRKDIMFYIQLAQQGKGEMFQEYRLNGTVIQQGNSWVLNEAKLLENYGPPPKGGPKGGWNMQPPPWAFGNYTLMGPPLPTIPYDY